MTFEAFDHSDEETLSDQHFGGKHYKNWVPFRPYKKSGLTTVRVNISNCQNLMLLHINMCAKRAESRKIFFDSGEPFLRKIPETTQKNRISENRSFQVFFWKYQLKVKLISNISV